MNWRYNLFILVSSLIDRQVIAKEGDILVLIDLVFFPTIYLHLKINKKQWETLVFHTAYSTYNMQTYLCQSLSSCMYNSFINHMKIISLLIHPKKCPPAAIFTFYICYHVDQAEQVNQLSFKHPMQR